MTLRTLVIGLLGAVFIGAVGYFNDQVPRVNYFVGNHFPIIVFCPLLLVAMVINPLLNRLRPGWRVRPAEVAIAVAMMLVACNIPGSGMLRFWSRNVAMPVHFNKFSPDWQKAEALQRVPPALLVNGGVYDADVNQKLIQGAGRPGSPIGFRDVPWGAWQRPIMAWGSIVALVAIASICIALVVHRTWATHDRLPYPIAQLAEAVMPGKKAGGSVFTAKLFWLGCGAVLAIHLVNGLNAWFGGRLIGIPLSFDIQPILLPLQDGGVKIGKWATGWPYWHVTIYPTALAFACLVAADVSLALGISPILLTIATTLLFYAGIPAYGSTMGGGFFEWLHAGSYVAIGLVLIYLGRRTYGQMLLAAFTPLRTREVRRHEVWALRGLLVTGVLLAWLLIAIGLAWPFAILVPGLILLMFLVMARINAESGLILIETWWQPIAMLMGLFGVKAMGLGNYAIIAMLCLQFTINGRECLLPLVINALRIGDYHRVPSGRLGLTGVVVFLVVLAVAVPFSLWVDYNYGLQKGEYWPAFSAPKRNFDYLSMHHKMLSSKGALVASEAMTPWQRITQMEPQGLCLAALGIGAAVVLLISWLRLRYTWWPLHPVLFLFWGTWSMAAFSFSFLVGWFVKQACVRLGVRQDPLKKLMFGVIAGDLLAGALWMTVGAVYFAVTGERPIRYLVYPGG